GRLHARADGGLMRVLSLRARLVLGVLALAAVGLAAADGVTYRELRSSLLARVDSTLQSEHQDAEHQQFGPGGNPTPDYVQLRATNGAVLYTSEPPHFGSAAASPPDLPKTIGPLAPQGRDLVRYFTVPAQSGGGRYRVRASIDGGSQ